MVKRMSVEYKYPENCLAFACSNDRPQISDYKGITQVQFQLSQQFAKSNGWKYGILVYHEGIFTIYAHDYESQIVIECCLDNKNWEIMEKLYPGICLFK